MPKITLPDGNEKHFSHSIDGHEIAESISKSLAKAALALEVDGVLVDLSTKIDVDCSVKIITANSPVGIDLLRHDAAHILAQAVQELFPDAQATIGPVIENGKVPCLGQAFYDLATLLHATCPNSSVTARGLPMQCHIYVAMLDFYCLHASMSPRL